MSVWLLVGVPPPFRLLVSTKFNWPLLAVTLPIVSA